MAKTKVSEWSTTPSSNTDIDGINISEGCAPSGINDAIRDMMAQIRSWQSGASADPFNGPMNGTIGATTAYSGAFTTLSATGAITSTLATGSAPLVIASTTKVANLNVDLLDGADWASPAAIGSTTPAAGSFTTLGASSTATLNTLSSSGATLTGGSINNMAIGGTTTSTGAFTTLSASSTVTLSGGTANGVAYLNGSKAVTSGSALTFDGTNFRITASNPFLYLQGTNGTGYTHSIYTSGVNADALQIDTKDFYENADTHIFRNSAKSSEFMRLNSTGLGIGTSSPARKLDVNGSIQLPTNNALYINGSSNYLYADTSAMELASATQLKLVTNGALRATLDSSGNLGLGVTPSASASVGNLYLPSAQTVTFSGIYGSMVTNAYYNAGWKYIGTGQAAYNSQEAGVFKWFTAASGTAGNAISFTQAMTLDANGVLLVGRTSPSISGVKVDAEGLFGSIKSGNWSWSFGASASTNAFVINDTTSGSSVERARIDSSGNLLVGATSQFGGADCKLQGKNGSSAQAVSFLWNATTTGDANFVAFGTEASITQRGSITYNRAGGLTVYNTTSDYRAKDIIGSVTDSGSVIDSVPVYMGKMKWATQERPMFIAHETPSYAHTGVKDAVDADGNPVYQEMDASALIPVMWAEIQSLRKRLADAGI